MPILYFAHKCMHTFQFLEHKHSLLTAWYTYRYCTLKLSLFLELLSEKSKFCHQIECLITSIDRINNDPVVKERLEKLKHSIESCVENRGRVYIFGSRMYGIAKDDSDVDLYFDTGKLIIYVKYRTYYSIL